MNQFTLKSLWQSSFAKLLKTNPGSQPKPCKLELLNLDQRDLPAVISAATIASTFNSGNSVLMARATPLADSALGTDLPGVNGTVASTLKPGNLLRDTAKIDLRSVSTTAEMSRQFAAAGFTVRTASETPDANGNVLTVVKTVRKTGLGATFQSGEVDGFNYWNRIVNGNLSGDIRASAGTTTIQLEMGVDLVNGQPRYWINPTSAVLIENLKGSSTARGSVNIGNLRDVSVSAPYQMDLDASLKFRDINGDRKIDINELRDSRGGIGAINGSINLNPTFNAKVAGVVPFRAIHRLTLEFANPRSRGTHCPRLSSVRSLRRFEVPHGSPGIRSLQRCARTSRYEDSIHQ
jgi:hypothetical protein